LRFALVSKYIPQRKADSTPEIDSDHVRPFVEAAPFGIDRSRVG